VYTHHPPPSITPVTLVPHPHACVHARTVCVCVCAFVCHMYTSPTDLSALLGPLSVTNGRAVANFKTDRLPLFGQQAVEGR
jgi:hypothetical protein